MEQSERRKFLIEYLLSEINVTYYTSNNPDEQKRLLRALFNARMPKPADKRFLRIQDEYLKEELQEKGIMDIDSFSPVDKDLYLWKGDITTLKCDAIVNAANSQMLGCFYPNHGCIDNAIHTYAGIQLRQACAALMKAQGEEAPIGTVKITAAYNLPCKYILHTVGPRILGKLTEKHEKQLADCYRSCLVLADKNGLKNLAFCCISTGEFNFPNDVAARIAVQTVKEYKKRTKSQIKVLFNVFKEIDYDIYAKNLIANR